MHMGKRSWNGRTGSVPLNEEENYVLHDARCALALASVHLDFVSFVFTEDALLSLIRAAISIWGTEEQKE